MDNSNNKLNRARLKLFSKSNKTQLLKKLDTNI